MNKGNSVVELRNWAILEIDFIDGHPPRGIHLRGETSWGSGRVTSEVLSFDKETKTFQTKGGTTYKLVGETEEVTGTRLPSAMCWKVWAEENKVVSTKDTSKEYINL